MSTKNIPESWLKKLGGGRDANKEASDWLTAFVESPKQAVTDILWGRFYFSLIKPAERGQLLSTWLEKLGNDEKFAERLDLEIANWILEDHKQIFGQSKASFVSALLCLFFVVDFSTKLPEDSRLNRCVEALLWKPLSKWQPG